MCGYGRTGCTPNWSGLKSESMANSDVKEKRAQTHGTCVERTDAWLALSASQSVTVYSTHPEIRARSADLPISRIGPNVPLGSFTQGTRWQAISTMCTCTWLQNVSEQAALCNTPPVCECVLSVTFLSVSPSGHPIMTTIVLDCSCMQLYIFDVKTKLETFAHDQLYHYKADT